MAPQSKAQVKALAKAESSEAPAKAESAEAPAKAESAEPRPPVAVAAEVKSWAQLVGDKNSQCEPCETYIQDLVASVRERLVILLKSAPAVGGINNSMWSI